MSHDMSRSAIENGPEVLVDFDDIEDDRDPDDHEDPPGGEW